MKLPSLFSGLHRPAKKKEYLFSLIIGPETVGAAIWSSVKDTVAIEAIASQKYEGGWEEIITASDTALSAACSDLSFGNEVEKVVFGLSPEFIDDDQIASQHLTELKRLCHELSLKPVGFVVIAEALAYHFSKTEGIPQSAIFVGVAKKKLSVSLFRVGKSVNTTITSRGSSIAKDFEQALEAFSAIEVLPSRIILYGEEGDLEQVKAELLNHPWQNTAAFLHFPKIEAAKLQTTIEAVTVAGASELVKNRLLDTSSASSSLQAFDKTSESTDSIMDKKQEDKSVEPTIQEEYDAEKSPPSSPDVSPFGFVRDQDIAQTVENEPKEESLSESVVRQESPHSNRSALLRLPHLAWPKLPLFRLPTQGLRIAMILVGLFIFLIGGILISLYITVPTAAVHVLVDPQTLTRDLEIKLDTKKEGKDNSDTVPATVVEVEVDGQKRASATGKKIVGDPASGEVTVYNKTANEKIFPKGTILIGPKSLQFTLTGEVAVASVSDVIVGTPGKAKARVTAVNIGSEGNLPASSDISFKDYPVTLYAARNEQSFSGGTSKEVQVVSKKDQDTIVQNSIADLDSALKEKLTTKLDSGMQLFPQSIDTTVAKKIFSHDVGSEASEFEVQVTLKARATTYQKEAVDTLIRKNILGLVPTNFTLSSETPDFSVRATKILPDGSVSFTAAIKASLVPLLAKDEIKKTLIGKSLPEVENILRQNTTIVGYEVVFIKELPFAKKTMPKLARNLTVEVLPR